MPDDFDPLFGSPAGVALAETALTTTEGGAAPRVAVAEPQRDAIALPKAADDGGSQIARPITGPSGQPAAEIVRMALFAPGMKVGYQGRECTVSHTVISCGELSVQLREIPQPVRHDQLIAPQTQLYLARTR